MREEEGFSKFRLEERREGDEVLSTSLGTLNRSVELMEFIKLEPTIGDRSPRLIKWQEKWSEARA